MTMSLRPVPAAIIILAASAVIAGGFLVAGSPEEARMRRLDDRRVMDLQRIQNAINVSFTRSRKMPETIDIAVKVQADGVAPVDPGTSAPYEYRIIEGQSFELCAVFGRASDPQALGRDTSWAHAAGRQCFPLTARDVSKPAR